VSDSDPSDPPGQGRGGNRAPQRPAGPTDNDPSDPAGRGRGRDRDLKST
jgi:translation initiation factor IF-2